MRKIFSWKKEWTSILILFLFFRLLYSLLGVTSTSRPDPVPLAGGPVYQAAAALLKTDPVSHVLVNIWFRWDTVWYLKIAASGFNSQDGSIAFMPLYPWLVRGLGALIGNALLAALILSNLACLAALLLFYEVALFEVRDRDIAFWGTFFLACFPTSFFLFAAYTDSLFLALTLAAWLFSRSGKWLSAGLFASLATLCRLQGALLGLVLLWSFLAEDGVEKLPIIHAGGSKPQGTETGETVINTRVAFFMVRSLKKLKKPGWLAALLPVLTFAGYALWLGWARLGSIPAALETHWGIFTVMPWTGFGLFLQRLVSTPRVFIDFIDLSLLVLMLILLFIGVFRLNSTLSFYSVLTLALFFMRGTPPHLLDSFSRYFLTLFPAFILLALMAAKNAASLKNRILRVSLLSISIGLQIFLLMGFLDWRWIA